MWQTNQVTGQDQGREGVPGKSRRQFLKLTGTTIVAGMTLSAGGFLRMANAGGFVDYLKYDGLGLADLVRRKEVKPEELLEAAITRIDAINPIGVTQISICL